MRVICAADWKPVSAQLREVPRPAMGAKAKEFKQLQLDDPGAPVFFGLRPWSAKVV